MGIVAAVSIGGYALYHSFFSTTSYGSVNVNIGAIDEKAVAGLCQNADGYTRIVLFGGRIEEDSGQRFVDENAASLFGFGRAEME